MLAYTNILLSHATKWETKKGGISPLVNNARKAKKVSPYTYKKRWAALSAQWYVRSCKRLLDSPNELIFNESRRFVSQRYL